MKDCLFCKMASGQMNVPKVYEDSEIFAINDINPQAPTHVLVIPKKHIATLLELNEGDQALIGKIYGVTKKIAKDKGLDRSGYRILANCLEAAGQSVFHIHFHLLGGRRMAWPPG